MIIYRVIALFEREAEKKRVNQKEGGGVKGGTIKKVSDYYTLFGGFRGSIKESLVYNYEMKPEHEISV